MTEEEHWNASITEEKCCNAKMLSNTYAVNQKTHTHHVLSSIKGTPNLSDIIQSECLRILREREREDTWVSPSQFASTEKIACRGSRKGLKESLSMPAEWIDRSQSRTECSSTSECDLTALCHWAWSRGENPRLQLEHTTRVTGPQDHCESRLASLVWSQLTAWLGEKKEA